MISEKRIFLLRAKDILEPREGIGGILAISSRRKYTGLSSVISSLNDNILFNDEYSSSINNVESIVYLLLPASSLPGDIKNIADFSLAKTSLLKSHLDDWSATLLSPNTSVATAADDSIDVYYVYVSDE